MSLLLRLIIFPIEADSLAYPGLVTPPKSLHPAYHLAVTSVSPRPEGTLARDWAPAIFPDRLGRISLMSGMDMAFMESMRPERPTPAASAVFPDRLESPALSPAVQQQASSFTELTVVAAPTQFP